MCNLKAPSCSRVLLQTMEHSLVAVHKVRQAILGQFCPPPPCHTLSHISEPPNKVRHISEHPSRDSICTFVLCKERFYKYQITVALHCIVIFKEIHNKLKFNLKHTSLLNCSKFITSQLKRTNTLFKFAIWICT